MRLIADAVESSLDVVSSLVVWGGLRITSRPADEDYPYGYGKAEALATVIVALLLVGAAAGIAVAAIREILTPHHMPAPFTLAVVPVVVVVKEVLFRRVRRIGHETGSRVVQADAWHHRSDAITSAAAFVGIAVALWGGPGWESADDWAALAAAAIIATNGLRLLGPTLDDLMDRMPDRPHRRADRRRRPRRPGRPAPPRSSASASSGPPTTSTSTSRPTPPCPWSTPTSSAARSRAPSTRPSPAWPASSCTWSPSTRSPASQRVTRTTGRSGGVHPPDIRAPPQPTKMGTPPDVNDSGPLPAS